jgi:hypothetical protein
MATGNRQIVWIVDEVVGVMVVAVGEVVRRCLVLRIPTMAVQF